MEIIIKASQLILSLSILVILHEMGHFIAARIFKTKVEKFYLFFDPWFSLFKIKKGDTEYGIGWLPLGGYVKIAGMIDESMDKEQLKEPAQPWEFRSKPAWQRLIIMLGGITMNVLLGIFIYSMILFFNGEEYIPAAGLKYGIEADSLGQQIGLRNGDRIIAVNGAPVERFNQIVPRIVINDAKTVTVIRDGNKKVLEVPSDFIKKMIDAKRMDIIAPRVPYVIDKFTDDSPAKKADLKKGDRIISIENNPVNFVDEARGIVKDHAGGLVNVISLRGSDTLRTSVGVTKDGFLGIFPDLKFIPTEKKSYGLLSSFPAGYFKAKSTIVDYVKQFKLVFSPRIQGYKHLGGFISIGSAFSPKWDWLAFWSFTGFLSLALAFMNLLPIPALDGGHVMFTLYEMITRKKPNEKFLEYAQIGGMIILFSLLLFANGNDILRLLH